MVAYGYSIEAEGSSAWKMETALTRDHIHAFSF